MSTPLVSDTLLTYGLNRLRDLVLEEGGAFINVIVHDPVKLQDQEFIGGLLEEEGTAIEEALELWGLLELIAPYVPIRLSQELIAYIQESGEKLSQQELEDLGRYIKYAHYEYVILTIKELDCESQWISFVEDVKACRRNREKRGKAH